MKIQGVFIFEKEHALEGAVPTAGSAAFVMGLRREEKIEEGKAVLFLTYVRYVCYVLYAEGI